MPQGRWKLITLRTQNLKSENRPSGQWHGEDWDMKVLAGSKRGRVKGFELVVTRLSLEGARCQECGKKLIDARASHSKGHAGFRVWRSGAARALWQLRKWPCYWILLKFSRNCTPPWEWKQETRYVATASTASRSCSVSFLLLWQNNLPRRLCLAHTSRSQPILEGSQAGTWNRSHRGRMLAGSLPGLKFL